MQNLSTNDWIKIGINTLVGFLTLILQTIIPIGGGGISLIFVLTIPFTIGVSLIASIIYLFSKPGLFREIVIYTAIGINLLVTFAMYPYG